MPGPYPVEVDVSIWQGSEAKLSRVECEDPKVWHGSTVVNCHVHFTIDPAQAPEPAMSAVLIGAVALAGLARKGGRQCAGS